MPFALTGAPATFQRLIDRVITPEMRSNVFSYLDGIIVVAETFDEHLSWVGKVLDRDVLKVDPDTVDPLISYPTLKVAKQLRRFLEMASWYRRFIPEFATIADLLTRLFRTNIKWHRGVEQEEAFKILNYALTKPPMLAYPTFKDVVENPFDLQTDASASGLGVVLTQRQGDAERVIAFAIVTDHSSLRWLNNLRNPTGSHARWGLELQGYVIEIIRRKGALHHVPDALSILGKSDDETLVCNISETTNSWYLRWVQAVQERPRILPDWKVEGGHLYRHRTDPLTNPIVQDWDSWKLLMPANRIKDLFMKWIECIPIRTANGHTIHKAFIDLMVSRWGAPQVVHIDNGTEFSNRLMARMCRSVGIIHTTNPVYHATANPTERVYRVLKTMIVSFLQDNHKEWNAHLHEIRFAVNTSVHGSLKPPVPRQTALVTSDGHPHTADHTRRDSSTSIRGGGLAEGGSSTTGLSQVSGEDYMLEVLAKRAPEGTVSGSKTCPALLPLW
ncbi:uncharacterized protein LOC117180509 [Belonocnema kinseyi]|uniref:uncharacterized protein LOC117180509 n=1 Tax=Belonocnema kinseyi TaxID=2817044 RepID=UPI00143DBB8A|nr:uncharacterized protein LOC117180509 [Belonocnema kinseyi]